MGDYVGGRIVLRGITGYGYHGVFPAERANGQPFIVDVSCDVDLAAAAASDDLADTVDYGALSQAVVHDIESDPLDLVEALADRIAETCLREPRVTGVSVVVHKPQAPVPVTVADVAVELRKSRRPGD